MNIENPAERDSCTENGGGRLPHTTDLPVPAAAASVGTNTYTMAVYWGRSGLERLAADRDHLARSLDAQRLADFFDWFRCYLDVWSSRPEAVFFCVVSRNQCPAAIVPFQVGIRRLGGIPVSVLELPNDWRMLSGDWMVTDGGDPGDYLPALLEHLAHRPGIRWDYLRLVQVAWNGSPAGDFARQFGFSPLRDRVGGSNACPVLPEEQRRQRLPKKFRSTLRERRKRLAAAGPNTVQTVSALPEIEQAFEDFLRVEAAGWKGARGSRTALLYEPRAQSMHQELLRRFAANGRSQIHLLRLGPRPIAGYLTLTLGDRVYLLKGGYDEAYAQLSPGVILLDELFQAYARDASIRYIDFLSEGPAHKDWGPEHQDLFDLYLFRRTWRGQFARAYFGVRQHLRYHRHTWLGPLYRRWFGDRIQRFQRQMKNQARAAPPG